MADLSYYLVLIEKSRKFQLSRLRFLEVFLIRMFDEHGDYMQEILGGKNQLPGRLASLDIGWVVAVRHDDSGQHYSEPVPPEQRLNPNAYKF